MQRRRVFDVVGVSILGGLCEGPVLSAVQVRVTGDWVLSYYSPVPLF